MKGSRLASQQLVAPRFSKPKDLVSWMGAVQAQDYASGLWAIGLRLRGRVTEADVEAAVAARKIVRTWPMRGTLHFVAAADVRSMLALLAPKIVARSAGRHRELGLSERDFTRSAEALARALEGGRALTRQEAYAAIERAGVSAAGQRGIHVVGHLAQTGLLCHGPRRGKQPTFVLLDEWVPPTRSTRTRGEALADLARRYLSSHGPASGHDFAWWSGLSVNEAQAAVEAAGDVPARNTRSSAPSAALLPMWDEYLVAYKDRAPALAGLAEPARASVFTPLVVIDGTVRGAWKRALTATAVRIELDLWARTTAREREAAEAAARRYASFLGKTLDLTVRR